MFRNREGFALVIRAGICYTAGSTLNEEKRNMLRIIMAFTPLVFLIIYALKTRKMAESMVLSTLLAMVLLYR